MPPKLRIEKPTRRGPEPSDARKKEKAPPEATAVTLGEGPDLGARPSEEFIKGLEERLRKAKEGRRAREAKEKAEKKAEDDLLESLARKGGKRGFTDDGLPIYTEEELRLNLPGSGNTPQCPFDCDCCF